MEDFERLDNVIESGGEGALPVQLGAGTSLAALLGFHLEPQEFLALPRARLAQGLTPEVLEGQAQPGQWILPGGRVAGELRGRVVGVRRARVLWQREPTPRVVCRSDDGATGVGDPGGSCAECPLSQWNDGPPACTLLYEYMVLLDEGVPVVVSLSTRSAGATIGQLNLAIRARGEVRVTMRSQLVVKGSKRYYVPTVTFDWGAAHAG